MINPHQQKISTAMQALAQAIPQAQADPARPQVHFTAPAGWLNDPNGTIYHDGWYHLFYQHHPFSDNWGPMYWGHARSRDLLEWEHLPIAFAPEMDGIENGIWSGCTAINKTGTPVAFYTRSNAPHAANTSLICEQNAAIGSDDLLTWEKFPANPVLQRDSEWRAEWRDPFIFTAEGRTFMVVGMCGPGTPLYEAVDDSLLHWEYNGMLCEIDAECPNFFQVDGGKWLFLSSPFNNVRYAIGTFDAAQGRFFIEQEGRYDWSEFGHSDAYATNHLYAPDGRSILFGWIRGWEPGHGWNGCMALPREVHIDANGILRTPPITELEQLRGEHGILPACELAEGSRLIDFPAGLLYELSCQLSPGTAETAGIDLGGYSLWLAKDGVHFDGIHIPLTEQERSLPVNLRLFVDHSVAELFVNDGQYCAVRVFKDFTPAAPGLRLFSSGGTTHLDGLEIWNLQSSVETSSQQFST